MTAFKVIPFPGADEKSPHPANKKPSRLVRWLGLGNSDHASSKSHQWDADPSSTDLRGSACIIGFTRTEATRMMQMLRDASVESCATSCSAEDIAQLTEVSNTFSHIVINIDAFDSVDRAVDTLMTFRTSFPTVRVLMVSSVVLNDDLGGHRKQVGDVTLRAPVSSERLKIALQAADANNRDWTASITPSQSEPCLQFPRSTYPEGLPG